MIGVLARQDEREAAREFFQLFKTPWEFCHPGGRYEIVLNTDPVNVRWGEALTIIFSVAALPLDEELGISTQAAAAGGIVTSPAGAIPVCQGLSLLEGGGWRAMLPVEGNEGFAALCGSTEKGPLLRVGFDIFREVASLLSGGQPLQFAGIPTLDRMIASLRQWILEAGCPVVEIPPVPAGYRLLACMTHDVDFYRFRTHFLDRTFFGFFYRACIMTPVNFLRGRQPLRVVWKNLLAVLMSPLVFLGLARDFWDLAERYEELEGGLPSTFFVVPAAGEDGLSPEGHQAPGRAVKYQASEASAYIRELASRRCEIGVHGINAWASEEAGAAEMAAVSEACAAPVQGIRTHWLYLSQDSFRHLENAGFRYDSSLGYNGAIGFRCGTAQVFKPAGVDRLLEIPLHIMDTALMYADRLDLGHGDAWELIEQLLGSYCPGGGVVTVNWHHRSVGPERYWDGLYRGLLDRLKNENAWFATATDVAGWFGKRRRAVFTSPAEAGGVVRVTTDGKDDYLPALVVRVHHPGGMDDDAGTNSRFTDTDMSGKTEITVTP